MAVFQGVRLRSPGLPVAAERDLRRVLPSARPSRLRPTAALMGVILAGTMLGLVYLTQTLGSNATTAAIARLEGEQKELLRRIGNQGLAVSFAADPIEIGRDAKRIDLERLDDPITLSAP
jgi:hypothetical protein